jgi:L-ascorbate metabolism protein UlaG (beta-lactamase superfamily)
VVSVANWLEHFNGRRFFNPGGPQARGFIDVLRWKLTSRPERSPGFIDDVVQAVSVQAVPAGAAVTLVNHATVLLQLGGVNVLTDPIWSERASPFSWIGPRRRRMPGIRQEHLPAIDIVLLSHNHYDHLDVPTLRWLARRGPSKFVVPLGLTRLLRSIGIENVIEMDWGATQQIGEIGIHFVPAVHFSARGLFDRNRTLWCGYVIRAAGANIYFAGDTAFGGHFVAIRETFGAPDLALLPIGAYKPKWFMSPVHMSPEEALDAHRILCARRSIAIHHGTFQLADDGIDAAREQLQRCAPPDSFLVLNNGESIDLL